MGINAYIEQTNLRPDLTDQHIDELITVSEKWNFHGICLPPFWVKRAAREMGRSELQLITVIGFPLGYSRTESKLIEIEKAIDDGANELDIVMNISAFKTGMPWAKIELAKCAQLIHQSDAMMKVIIETAYLSDEEIILAAKMSADAGTDFVKTSSGFAPEGAKLEQIKLIRSHLSSQVGIKASGGIKNLQMAQQMIDAGADRLGVSAGVAIMEEKGLD